MIQSHQYLINGRKVTAKDDAAAQRTAKLIKVPPEKVQHDPACPACKTAPIGARDIALEAALTALETEVADLAAKPPTTREAIVKIVVKAQNGLTVMARLFPGTDVDQAIQNLTYYITAEGLNLTERQVPFELRSEEGDMLVRHAFVAQAFGELTITAHTY